MLIEQAQVPDTVLPLVAFKAHLRLGTGFAEDDVQEAVLTSFLQAAMASIESRVGKALISRTFTWTLSRWRTPGFEVLPLAPVTHVQSLVITDHFAAQMEVPPESYALELDGQSPRLVAISGAFPAIPVGGKAEITFAAGYADTWDALPNDLAQAVFLLAAHYYEYRDETSLARGCMPFGVQSLLERHRPMRLFGGGER